MRLLTSAGIVWNESKSESRRWHVMGRGIETNVPHPLEFTQRPGGLELFVFHLFIVPLAHLSQTLPLKIVLRVSGFPQCIFNTNNVGIFFRSLKCKKKGKEKINYSSYDLHSLHHSRLDELIIQDLT